jgi:hypothetical protein
MPRSPLVDLAVGIYVVAAGVVVLFALGWATAPFENTDPPSTAFWLGEIGLAVAGLATAVAMALAFWGGNPRNASLLFLLSVASLLAWAIVIGIAF